MTTTTLDAKPQRPALRPDFFEEAFKNYNVPAKLRTFAEAFCIRFNVRGICDPAYCANSAALKLKIGDGCGKFDHEKDADENGIPLIGDQLLFAYSSCIQQTEPGTTAAVINSMVKAALAGATVEELVSQHAAPAAH
ncbi:MULTISPECIES: hypothetical protein [Pseudomonas]|uniref:Uncharacterized protein n=4 Tax=Pseudomonas TaxID=286 RepID=A0A3G1DGP7_PSEAI|nr:MULTISPECIES: hypothetical protein [Pseudomonas]MCO6692755.1 hypothetical protein [Pseudomonas shirazica]AMP35827.1 Hypothetical protein [Pseudomonas aeruginosa]ESW38616.1 hypothetical protein O164_17225 [Pseudomonas taiwanensis SJ9]KIC79794.1 hypothetical protein RR51_24720 [Pseudomonas sp. C5pp]MCE0755527.1 hypothetical protein [Pseudomonas asiatica]